ncbi:zinc-binding alcohol dehydrogenase family protein [Modestobacter muralis]|uniref:Zinc-binding alcohol dehydrogenase family protein n=1 Tax=Modestobacter muralis TaxID=1608614 RepID=A0A6P0H5K0_9ACTN|nr:zinc-binding alcohol dehydrogenase family protein [Modestobacter muralis]NEN50393.1 zinc-binding alcohol dehydrogenase family protein [Modestobacter muralis]
MPSNTAAWITGKYAQLEVGPAPYPTPGADQVVVRGHAVAINPLDWVIQVAGPVAYRWLRYPTVLGSDVAGEVVEIGSAVTRFAVGDRVLGHAVGTDQDSTSPAEGTFQQYTVLLERMASPIPDTLTYERAAVLPLALSTASAALFQTDLLGLRHPTASPERTGEVLLVWGGSTSVGSNAVQLAVAAGYDVVSTASPRNHEHVRSLGAGQVLDHSSPTVVADLIAALAGRTVVGAVALGATSLPACVQVVAASTGRKVVVAASTPVSFEGLGDADRPRLALPRTMLRLVGKTVAQQVRARRAGVRTPFVFGTSLKHNEVSTAVYRDFLPAALAEGRYVAAPEPLVVGSGLECLQEAMDVQRRGVSARKVVVTLA